MKTKYIKIPIERLEYFWSCQDKVQELQDGLRELKKKLANKGKEQEKEL